jgi:hypothetical protein
MPYPGSAVVARDDSGAAVTERSFLCVSRLEWGRASAALDLFGACRQVAGSTLVRYTGAFIRGGRFHVRCEYQGAGVVTLSDLVSEGQPVPEASVCDILGQILLGMLHLHARGLAHSCLGAGAVLLLPDGTVRVADAGLRQVVEMVCGFFSVSDPQPPEPGAADERSDVWVVGAVLDRICALAPTCSDTLRRIRTAMLDSDPARRPTVAGLIAAPVLQAQFARMTRGVVIRQGRPDTGARPQPASGPRKPPSNVRGDWRRPFGNRARERRPPAQPPDGEGRCRVGGDRAPKDGPKLLQRLCSFLEEVRRIEDPRLAQGPAAPAPKDSFLEEVGANAGPGWAGDAEGRRPWEAPEDGSWGPPPEMEASLLVSQYLLDPVEDQGWH